MSTCRLCLKKSSIDCCQKTFCEICIADHITTITETKHNPMPSNLKRTHELTKAIHKKICNELLELQEFKTSSLKIIAGFSSELKLEVDNYINSFQFTFLQSCRKIQIDLETAAQVLYTNNLPSPVLDLFAVCSDSESVSKISLIEKKFDLPILSIKSTLENSLSSEVKFNFTSTPKESFLVRRNSSLLSSGLLNDSFLPLQRTQSLIGVPNTASKFRVLDFSRPISDTLYSIFPFSNKIYSFNIKEESKSEVCFEGVKFPSKAAWTMTKDGRLIVTGGFDEAPKKNVFSLSFHNSRSEELGKMSLARFNHAQLTIDNHVYVFGGMNKSTLQDCEKFNLDTKKWARFAMLNVGREFPAAVHHFGKVFVAGGNGIESIESCTLNSKRFELLLIRLPSPGRINFFFVDSQAVLLIKEKVISLDFKSNTYKQIGAVPDPNLWTSSDYLQSIPQISWISDGRLITFDTKSITLKITE